MLDEVLDEVLDRLAGLEFDRFAKEIRNLGMRLCHDF